MAKGGRATKASSGVKDPNNRLVASNRRARRDYEVLDTVEAGIVLRGSEVKSLRDAEVQLADTYARIIDGEAWLVGLHIAPYRNASTQGDHEPERDRKLLLHRKELETLDARIAQQRLTLVPLSLYFKDGKAKLELALGKGRNVEDKRQVIAKRDAERDAAKEMAHARRQSSARAARQDD
jgi:SsrA-binding protein